MSSLIVTIQNTEFAKDFKYFLTCQLDGLNQKRTEVSPCVSNPVFSDNTFTYPLISPLEDNNRLQFAAFALGESQQQAKLLGDCIVQLDEILLPLQEIGGNGVRQHLKFYRETGGQRLQVGRFIINIALSEQPLEQSIVSHKLLSEKPLSRGNVNEFIEDRQQITDKIEDEQERQMKESKQKIEVEMEMEMEQEQVNEQDKKWRIEVLVREVLDLKLNKAKESNGCVQAVWNMYDTQVSSFEHSTPVINQRHIQYDHLMTINSPTSIVSPQGFLHLQLTNNLLPILYKPIPIPSLIPYHPYHIKWVTKDKTTLIVSIQVIYLSPDQLQDQQLVLQIQGLDLIPFSQSNRVQLMLGVGGKDTDKIEYRLMEDKKNIAYYLEQMNKGRKEGRVMFISSLVQMPGEVRVVFNILRSMLGEDKEVRVYVLDSDNSKSMGNSQMNVVAGGTNNIQQCLVSSLYGGGDGDGDGDGVGEKTSQNINWNKMSKNTYNKYKSVNGMVHFRVVVKQTGQEQNDKQINTNNLSIFDQNQVQNISDINHSQINNNTYRNSQNNTFKNSQQSQYNNNESNNNKTIKQTHDNENERINEFTDYNVQSKNTKEIMQKYNEGDEYQTNQQSLNDRLGTYMGSDLRNIKKESDKWSILSRELSQKQEIIHRMIKEIDDKSDSLKISGSEIMDLRKQIKMLQSENHILRKKLNQEEKIDIKDVLNKEIARMGPEELKAKIIKIAQVYRDERVRNEEFEKALRNAQKDISQTKQLQSDLEQYQMQHQKMAQKMLVMQKEANKTGLYKETVKKQEKVIQKLESLLEKSLIDTQKARESQMELQKIKTENIELQRELKQLTMGGRGELSNQENKYKSECYKLQGIISNLKEELNNQRPQTQNKWQVDSQDKIELEVQLQRANIRIESLQNEMTSNAKKYAQQISSLKIQIGEKQGLLETMNDF